MKQILCMSSEPWSNRLPGRTQQIISRLRDAQILYFYPAQSTRDRSYLKGVRQVRPNVAVCALPPIRFPIPERRRFRSEEHTSELQSHTRSSRMPSSA